MAESKLFGNLDQIILAAGGRTRADVLLKNAKVVNVFSGEIEQTDIALLGPFVVGLGNHYQAKEEQDLQGLYLCSGLIDGHMHIESSMMEIPEFARAVVPRGTTSVVADPHEIANVLGHEGIRYMLEMSKHNPLNVFFMLPSCVPSTSMETAGSQLKAFDLYPFLSESWVLGLAEVMNYPGVIHADEDVLDKIKIARGKRVDGHAPGLTGLDLCAYAASGVTSDHECTTLEEAREKLHRGLHIMIREGSVAKNLLDLLPLVTRENERRFMFCTDDRHPNDIFEEGHVDFLVRTAIQHGLDPITAIRLATLNPAEYFKIQRAGAVAPGYYADLIAFDDFPSFRIRRVYKNGQLVARDGEPLWQKPARPQISLRSSVNIQWLTADHLVIPRQGRRCRIIQLTPRNLYTDQFTAEPKTDNGIIVADTARDLLKIAVIERHSASGNVGRALVHGFGFQKGAVASSVSHDSHNIVVVGVDDDDMLIAARKVQTMNGGIAVARDGAIIDALELPVAGLMSRLDLAGVSHRVNSLLDHCRTLGTRVKNPLMAMSFLALPVIPKLKLTDRGLVDVEKFQLVDLFVE